MGNIYSGSCLEVVKTKDLKAIKDLIFHQDIVKELVFNDYDDIDEKLERRKVIFYLFKIDNKNVGFAAFLDMQHLFKADECYLVDVGFLKEFRGKFAYKLAKIALDKFMLEVFPKGLFALIDIKNKKSLFFSLKTGFEILSKDDKYYFLEAKTWEV
jgi:predicted acetyltransferase